MEKRYLIQVKVNDAWSDYGMTDLNSRSVLHSVENSVFNCQSSRLIDTYTGEVIQ